LFSACILFLGPAQTRLGPRKSNTPAGDAPIALQQVHDSAAPLIIPPHPGRIVFTTPPPLRKLLFLYWYFPIHRYFTFDSIPSHAQEGCNSATRLLSQARYD
jgi:hypothetical protein